MTITEANKDLADSVRQVVRQVRTVRWMVVGFGIVIVVPKLVEIVALIR